MKGRRCILRVNTRNGYLLINDREFSSVSAAVKYAKNSWGFYFSIFDAVTKEHIRGGFCE